MYVLEKNQQFVEPTYAFGDVYMIRQLPSSWLLDIQRWSTVSSLSWTNDPAACFPSLPSITLLHFVSVASLGSSSWTPSSMQLEFVIASVGYFVAKLEQMPAMESDICWLKWDDYQFRTIPAGSVLGIGDYRTPLSRFSQ